MAIPSLSMAAGPLINGNQINPQTAISIATFSVTGAVGSSTINNDVAIGTSPVLIFTNKGPTGLPLGINMIQSGSNFNAGSSADLQITSMKDGASWVTIKNTTGRVGIGTTNPGQLLDVNGQVVIRDLTEITNTLTVDKNIVATTSVTAGAFFGDGSHLTGTIPPADLPNTVISSWTVLGAGGLLVSGGNGSYSVIASSNAASGEVYWGSTNATGRHWAAVNEQLVNGDWALYQGASAKSAPLSGTAAVYLDNNRNLGVNTTVPGSRIDVNGDATIRGQETVTSSVTVLSGGMIVRSGRSNFFSGDAFSLVLGQTPGQSNDAELGTNANGNLIASDSSAGAMMTWAQSAVGNGIGVHTTLPLTLVGSSLTVTGAGLFVSGNVGIGTSSPGAALQINKADEALYLSSGTAAGQQYAVLSYGGGISSAFNLKGTAGHAVTIGANASSSQLVLPADGSIHLGSLTGTQVYVCTGGTNAGWVLYGNSGAAQTLCTGGGGSLTATGTYLP